MLAIRFDGPPGPEGGRFIEVELDGKSVRFGEWKQEGRQWILIAPPEVEAAFRTRPESVTKPIEGTK